MNNPIIIAVLLLTGIAMSANAQKHNQKYSDSKGKEHLIGKCNRQGLQQAPYKEWFDKFYNGYEVDKTVLKKCKKKLKNVKIEIFMATWCGDSKREVPRFYKILDELGIKDKQIKLINLFGSDSLYKQSPTHEERGKLIHRVPTFIFYKKGKEIGRIVETPATSFEMDIAQIANGLPSAPNYHITQTVNDYFEKEGISTDRKELLPFARKIYKQAKSRSALNTYGYVLMANNEMEKAIAVFTMNTILFSREPNPWDSLAEAYEKNNEIDKAVSTYKHVLELNPNSKHANERVLALEKVVSPNE